VQIIANKLKCNGDIRVVEKIIRSLIDDFENVVYIMDKSRNLEEMTINDIKGSLVAHSNTIFLQTKGPRGSLTNKDDHQGEQGYVWATQPRKRTRT